MVRGKAMERVPVNRVDKMGMQIGVIRGKELMI